MISFPFAETKIMAKVPLKEADIKDLINLAWNQLGILITGLTPEESNQVIRDLLKELEALHSKMTLPHKNNDNSPKGEVENIETNLVTDIQGESIEPNSEENEIAEEDNFLKNQENEKSLNEPVEVIDNKWYTFISNVKNTEAENEKQFEDENDEIKETDELQPSICQKNFAQNVSLKVREMNQSGGGKVPYECRICSKRFKQKCHLNRHEIIHTGEVPFGCKTCKKRFNQSSTLKKHERIHTGEVP